MAFINNTAATGSLFVRVGNLFDANTANLVNTSTSLAESNGAITFTSDMVNKLIVFGNGKTKSITGFVDANTVNVSPTFSVPAATDFNVHEASLSIDQDSRILINKAFSDDLIMQNEKGIDMNHNKIRNLPLPVHAFDSVNKQYVDSAKFSVWNYIQTFDGDGNTTQFASNTVIDIKNAMISVGGVLQEPYTAYTFSYANSTPYINFTEAPSSGTKIILRASEGGAVERGAALEEYFTANSATANQTFVLSSDVLDYNSLLVTIDGVVQGTQNFSVQLTDPYTANGQYFGNEYRKLVFTEPLVDDSVVRVVNLKGTTLTGYTGTTIVIDDLTLTPNATSGAVVYDTVANSNSVFNVTHDMITSRRGLNLFANTSNSVLINLPEMGGLYSPDNFHQVKVVKAADIYSIIVNSDANNYFHYEGHPFDNSGANTGGYAFNAANTVSTLELEWESTFNTWVITGGFSVWTVYNGTANTSDL